MAQSQLTNSSRSPFESESVLWLFRRSFALQICKGLVSVLCVYICSCPCIGLFLSEQINAQLL